MEKRVMTVRDVYKYLNGTVGINRVRNLMASGQIISTLFGNKYVTEQVHVDRFINAQFVKSNTKYH